MNVPFFSVEAKLIYAAAKGDLQNVNKLLHSSGNIDVNCREVRYCHETLTYLTCKDMSEDVLLMIFGSFS